MSTKRSANKAKKRRSGTLKTQADVARTKLRRRVGDVKRLEVVLVADSPRDQYIVAWMDDHLARGEASEFTRAAIEEKVAREVTGESEAAQQLAALFQMLADRDHLIEQLFAKLDRMSEQLADLQRRPITIAQTIMPDAIPEHRAVVESSGIDTSRPRPRAAPRQIAAPTPPPDVLSDEEAVRLAQVMAESVRKAQPGRQ